MSVHDSVKTVAPGPSYQRSRTPTVIEAVTLSELQQREAQVQKVDLSNKLPVEILGEVATVLASIEPLGIWKFASVCRYWRITALSTPEAWSYIYPGSGSSETEAEAAAFQPYHMKLWLERAKIHPLQVSLRTYKSTNALLGENWPRTGPSSNRLEFPWHRVKSLHLASLLTKVGSRICPPAGNTLDALEDLCLENYLPDDVHGLSWPYARPQRLLNVMKALLIRKYTTSDTQNYNLPHSHQPNHIYHHLQNPIPSQLRRLSIYNLTVTIHAVEFFPELRDLAHLQSLKLVKCQGWSNLMDFVLLPRKTLTSLCLDLVPNSLDVSKSPSASLVQLAQRMELGKDYEEEIKGWMELREANETKSQRRQQDTDQTEEGSSQTALVFEFPLLKRLSITVIPPSNKSLEETLNKLKCPSLTKLNIDDTILPPTPATSSIFQAHFPSLTYLAVRVSSSFGSMKVYDILSNSNIALTGLTVFYAYEPNGCWMLLWRLANDPSLGKTLRKVRIVVLLGQNIPKDILESLNKSRSRFRKVTNNATADNHANNLEPCLDSGVDPADDFARVVVVPSSPNLEPSAQWDIRPWWSRDSIWHQ